MKNQEKNQENDQNEWQLCGCGGQAVPPGCLCRECEQLMQQLEDDLPPGEDIFIIGQIGQGYGQ